ncbi:MAG: proline--tRNA ligase [Candidatus Omnitrophica bacterium]|nr:proline--tRNA ligase [Candidatus Omnitrophota bacterium]
MRWKETLIPTLKEVPADAETVSHILMVRAGLIRKLGAGTYSYLPLGLKVIQKINTIIRQEMDAVGAQEILMPALQSPELWKRTGRFDLIKEIMFQFKDRHGKVNLLGPTHEEVVTDIVAKEVRSYKQLPLMLYQIQTKFRDEPRPRFGILRSREFIMKDAYSFNKDWDDLDKSYKKMYDAYCRIFDRCGLKYVAVEADAGFMGGDVSHEFMVPAEKGEDLIIVCESCGYAASREKAECAKVDAKKKSAKENKLKEVSTPGVSTVEGVAALLKTKESQLIKTLIYIAGGKPIAVLLRGDHEVNEAKLKRYLGCTLLEMAEEKAIKDATGGPLGFSGPVGLKGVKIVADHAVLSVVDGVTGANKKDTHLVNVNVGRDFKVKEWADLRYFVDGDICPKCSKKPKVTNAIEIGHTFKLGTKYSKSLGARYLDEKGAEHDIIMGCYGIGVNRIAAAAIEGGNDKDGIIWPISIAPYAIAVMPLNTMNNDLSKAAEDIYNQLRDNGLDVIIDDRDERAGIKFKDADLVGFPIQVILGERNIAKGKVEMKLRKTGKSEVIDMKKVVEEIKKNLT